MTALTLLFVSADLSELESRLFFARDGSLEVIFSVDFGLLILFLGSSFCVNQKNQRRLFGRCWADDDDIKLIQVPYGPRHFQFNEQSAAEKRRVFFLSVTSTKSNSQLSQKQNKHDLNLYS